MRNQHHVGLALLVSLVLVAAPGCTTAPVLDMQREVPGASGSDIADAIFVALTQKGWVVNDYVPGSVGATIRVQSHYARIRLDYDDHSYAITCVETSASLKFDGHIVHKRYNRWVKALDDAIMLNLRAPAR